MRLSWLIFVPALSSCNLPYNSILERAAKSGYQPLDPIPVRLTVQESQVVQDLLPNETMRFAVGQVESSGGISYAPFTTTVKEQTYRAVLDYMKYSTIPLAAEYSVSEITSSSGAKEFQQRLSTRAGTIKVASRSKPEHPVEIKTEFVMAQGIKVTSAMDSTQELSDGTVRHEIPIYVGIGLRIEVTLYALESNVSLSSIYGIGIAASQNKLSGSIIVQTIGLSGPNISSVIPFPDEINLSTIQTAMQAMAMIKSRIYEPKTTFKPQVLGINSSFELPGTIPLIISTLQASDMRVSASKDGDLFILDPHKDPLPVDSPK